MSAYDNKLPFSPLTDRALAQVAFREMALAAGRGFPTCTYQDLEDAVYQRLTGDRYGHVLGIYRIEVGDVEVVEPAIVSRGA